MTTHATPGEDTLVWIDLEMTGLDPDRHVILQAALIVTTSDLKELDHVAIDIFQPEEALAGMSPLVAEMHAATGLLERVRKSTVDLARAESALVARLQKWCSGPATLCGNSIWSDRIFLRRHMPGLDRLVHYRMIDVSSIKVLAGRWYGEDAVFPKPTAGQHDALVDARNSIAELEYYRRVLFRSGRSSGDRS